MQHNSDFCFANKYDVLFTPSVWYLPPQKIITVVVGPKTDVSKQLYWQLQPA